MASLPQALPPSNPPIPQAQPQLRGCAQAVPSACISLPFDPSLAGSFFASRTCITVCFPERPSLTTHLNSKGPQPHPALSLPAPVDIVLATSPTTGQPPEGQGCGTAVSPAPSVGPSTCHVQDPVLGLWG